MTSRRHVLTLAVTSAVALALGGALGVRPTAQSSPAAFASLIDSLSEPGGDFDTDNLISNERSYLHVVPDLEQVDASGSVYVGVGPDQNFSYIARLRPATAFIIDIRRDNLLLHLLFKAIFAVSRNRMEFLSVLTGRERPARLDDWHDATIDAIVRHLDRANPARAGTDDGVRAAIVRFGVPLSRDDLATIDRFHGAFVAEGLSLRFHSSGRPPNPQYPTYRDLLLETDRGGRQMCYLAREDDFQFVRALQARDGIVPVVGDLGGEHALVAIGRLVAERGQNVSAFYVSNVEDYLLRSGRFDRYMVNLERLPRSKTSIVIRSAFRAFALPESVPGYYSTSLVQNLNEFVAECGGSQCRTYWDLFRR